MNENVRKYILQHWKEYKLTDTYDKFIALINILQAHNENIDSLHSVALNGYNEFCGIWGDFESDRDVVNTLFEFDIFYSSEEQLMEIMHENAEYEGVSVEEYMQYEDIRKTTDGFVRVIHC